jgi:hypothetical protein
MSAIKLERTGVSFGIGGQGRPVTIEFRTHHDTIAAIRGGQVCLELLDGITQAQAQKLVDVLNENVSGMLVTTLSDDQRSEQRNEQRKSAAAFQVATKL